jgi:hypothetical protein
MGPIPHAYRQDIRLNSFIYSGGQASLCALRVSTPDAFILQHSIDGAAGSHD